MKFRTSHLALLTVAMATPAFAESIVDNLLARSGAKGAPAGEMSGFTGTSVAAIARGTWTPPGAALFINDSPMRWIDIETPAAGPIDTVDRPRYGTPMLPSGGLGGLGLDDGDEPPQALEIPLAERLAAHRVPQQVGDFASEFVHRVYPPFGTGGQGLGAQPQVPVVLVPLPPAAWAGFATLACLVGASAARTRRRG